MSFGLNLRRESVIRRTYELGKGGKRKEPFLRETPLKTEPGLLYA